MRRRRSCTTNMARKVITNVDGALDDLKPHIAGLKEGGHGHGDPTSMFEQFFGGGGGSRRGPQKCDDFVRKLVVDLEDLYKGRQMKLAVVRKRVCVACRGNGTKSGKEPPTCATCGGHGVVVATQRVGPGFVQRVRRECYDCHGRGVRVVAGDMCGTCKGEKVADAKALIDVYITPGMETGQKLTFRGEADEAPNMEAGDIIVVLQQRPHARFERDGDDLKTTVRVPLIEALSGAVLQIDALDGRELRVQVPAGRVLRPHEVIVVRGEGMPHHKSISERGELMVKIEIEMPRKAPDAAQMKQLEALIGARRVLPPPHDNVEDCEMAEFNEDEARKRKQEREMRAKSRNDATHAEDEERRGGGGGGGMPGGVQCAQQ